MMEAFIRLQSELIQLQKDLMADDGFSFDNYALALTIRRKLFQVEWGEKSNILRFHYMGIGNSGICHCI